MDHLPAVSRGHVCVPRVGCERQWRGPCQSEQCSSSHAAWCVVIRIIISNSHGVVALASCFPSFLVTLILCGLLDIPDQIIPRPFITGVGQTSLTLSWTAPNMNGSPFINYYIYVSTNFGPYTFLRTSFGAGIFLSGYFTGATNYSFTVCAVVVFDAMTADELLNLTLCGLQVQARNVLGYGLMSNASLTVRTLPCNSPWL
jgi:hypothetical protein